MTTSVLDPTAERATRLDLLDFKRPPMRAFHMTWIAFFICFYAWFAVAPLMPVITKQFHLTKLQVADINVAAVLVTVLFRVVVGPLCDRIGPRRAYVGLLVLGAIPVFGLALAQSYGSLLFFRLLIGGIGASFVITQYHTSVMIAPNVVGTANATAGGWGNAGAGVAQTLSPLLATLVVSLGMEHQWGWRAALFVPGFAMLITAVFYWRLTQDLPQGDMLAARRAGLTLSGVGKHGGLASTGSALGNYRVWLLALCYGGCFGVEIFIHNVAATYYVQRFGLSVSSAGFAAGSFGLLAFFGRPFGGIVSDAAARRWGLDGRTALLFATMVAEGAGLLLFGHASSVGAAVATMLLFGLFVHMSAGATYAIMPFLDRTALGGVCGVIGAGGNLGAVAAALLNRAIPAQGTCLTIIGVAVICIACCALAVRFSAEKKIFERTLFDDALAKRSLA